MQLARANFQAVHKLAGANMCGKGVISMPLTFATIGEENIVKRVGGKPEVKKHLEDLGFVVGSRVTVINTMGGNLIVRVKEARVALSSELAQKILI